MKEIAGAQRRREALETASNEGPSTIRLAAWQGRCVDGDVDANLAAARRAIAEAGERSADFLCLPETFLSGYGSREVIERAALSLEDPCLAALAAEAAARDLVLLVGDLQSPLQRPLGRHDGRPPHPRP
jgi:predicted amidohydrolase